ncbi:MAG TPA: DALR domain-containing protein, partial [Tepidisphaeraceae bacterium]|nr:DALR domain-containing protein [Tepidisphaeraceae bacterium]
AAACTFSGCLSRSSWFFSMKLLISPANSKKGLAVFQRLFERMERITGGPLAENAPDMDQAAASLADADFAKAILSFKAKYVEMMDDDFNTAGGIAVMHELAGEINSFIEKNQLERDKQPEKVQAAAAATVTLRQLGQVLGLFRKGVAKAESSKDSALVEQLMQLFIRLRQEARKSKNFALADGIRKGLTEIGVTLEDRADGTLWRKE